MPPKARYTKSRFGCHTCRIRKVRCDETWPECHKCTSTGRRCDGPSKQKFVFVQTHTTKVKEVEYADARSSSITTFPSSSNQHSPSEARAFQYFVQNVAPCLAGSQDESFWTYLVPRVCQTNAAVRHAVLTISCMYEHPFEASQLHMNCLDPASQAHLLALKWHSQSIRGFRDILSTVQDSEQAEIALMSCILLASIEYVQNNVVNASKILNNGYNITSLMSAQSGQVLRESATVRDILAPILVRQPVHMAIFGHQPPQSWLGCFQNLIPTSVTSIASLSEARASLYNRLWSAMEFLQAVLPLVLSPQNMSFEDSSHYYDRQQDILNNLASWSCSFRIFHLDHAAELSPSNIQAEPAMQMYFYVAHIWVTNCLDITHMQYDSETYRFKQIIECAEKVISTRESMTAQSSDKMPPAFTFEMGVIPPLLFTGWHCRHPLLRRKCVELLQRAPKQEALLVADWIARAIEQIIKLEETKELRQAIEMGRWDGKTLPCAEMRCQHVTIHHEDHEGRKVSPRLVCLRKIRKGVFDEAQGERLFIELY